MHPYFEKFQQPFQLRMMRAWHVVLGEVPHAEIRIAYGMLFCYYRGAFCYVYKAKKGNPYIGFVHGYALTPNPLLTQPTQKKFKLFYLRNGSEKELEYLREIIREALVVQDFAKK